jgi:hypothetical protein
MAHSKGIVLSLNKVLTLTVKAVKKVWRYMKSLGNDKMFYIIGMKNKRGQRKVFLVV